MPAPRLLATAALLATATLGLVACDPTTPVPTSSPSSSSASAPVTSSPVTPSSPSASTGSGKPSSHPSTSRPSTSRPSATARPSASTSPVADCTARAHTPGYQVINVVSVVSGSNQLNATQTKFICGADVPDDGYYEPVGAPSPYRFAPGATAELLVLGDSMKLSTVPLAQFLTTADVCAQNHDVARPYACFGSKYDITVDSSGQITHISELFHP
ncbi:hypothetical protein [Kitasatospora sp. MAP5-34]|uniref:hypothetical protein n=1 Tax=Kitasatospora sp. MAP5-34 TaxID=3035102 RepID=UPI00247415C5|nr:hypothetical protein [Kitasatospora sp. MAP5-34]MDH6578973.1 hypothetical protein [Kitasatospora sp. MAP5-34]